MEPLFGTWGAVPTGAAWSADGPARPADAILSLDPGAYDVYWTQGLRHTPQRIATGVLVQAGAEVAVPVSGARLDAASWVPAPQATYGSWSLAAPGSDGAATIAWAPEPGALVAAPGTYDVFWKQTLEHDPMRIARDLVVAPGAPASLALDSGIRLDAADWVPPPEGSYGWWGAVASGGALGSPVHWARVEGALPLPPGSYDIAWKQTLQHDPFLVARGVAVTAGSVAAVPLDAGVRLDVAEWLPLPEGSYGWWGIVPHGASVDVPLHWSRLPTSLAVAPGTYDVLWKQDLAHAPLAIFRGVSVPAAQRVDLTLDSGLRLGAPLHVEPTYGWWGATPAGSPDERVQWSDDANATLVLPPGTYDVVHQEGLGATPRIVAQGVEVVRGRATVVDVGSGVVPPTPTASTRGTVGAATTAVGPELDARADGLAVTFTLRGLEAGKAATLVAVGPDGVEHVVGPAGEAGAWSAPESGLWRLEARGTAADGGTRVLAQDVVLVLAPLATAGKAIGATVIGTTVVLVGARAFDLLDYARRLVTQSATDGARERTKDVAAIERWRKLGSRTAATLAILLMALFVTLGSPDLSGALAFVRSFALVGLAVLLFEAIVTGGQMLVHRKDRLRPPYRLWTAGTLAVAVTSIVFRVPFGYTGYIERIDGERLPEERRRAGLSAVAGLALMAVSVGVFLAAARFAGFGFGRTGLAMALGAFAVCAMPLAPLLGHAVWRWSRPAGAAMAIAAFALHYAHAVGAASPTLLATAALVGLAAYGVVLWRAERQAAEFVDEATAVPP